MTRQLLKDLTKIRIDEANQLLQTGFFDGAYYLSGYSLECALKACIVKSIFDTLPEKGFVDKCYTHDLNTLVKLASLERERGLEESRSSDFAINWAIVKGWNESTRYQRITEIQAREIYNSITTTKGGVLQWIQQYW
jgi:HEPN domain-containing protein